MRVCTWNILLGLRLNAVLEAVRTLPDFHELDLLALQEASVHDGRSDAEAIAEALGPGYSCFQATAQLFRRREQANALIWRDGMFQRNAGDVVSLRCLVPSARYCAPSRHRDASRSGRNRPTCVST